MITFAKNIFMSRPVRVRFAPSPTGPLHIGGVRTALFNYLFAKKNNGKFILRIEDTDQGRFVAGAEEYIIESLKWCGINFDEDVVKGGNYGPYRQSDRKDIYKQYADQLIASGNAYFAFDTSEELDALRKKHETEKLPAFQYDVHTRGKLRNSLTLNEAEVKNLLSSGTHYVIRFKMPENITVTMNDIIRGEVKVNTNTLDDKVLFKSDGMPTYHLANIADDHLMEISHVIRGEEWLPSLPLHTLLYRAFGWEETMPEFAHLPLILKPDGKGKLSKRDGDKMGFPVFPINWNNPDGEIYSGYREWGYFPEAFVNMLALLGWNPGTEQEIFSIEQLCEIFTLDRVGKSGSRFDPEKTKWFNQQYVRNKSNGELADLLLPLLAKEGVTINHDFVSKICGLMKERATFVKDIIQNSKFFFISPDSYDENAVRKHWKPETPQILNELAEILKSSDDFTVHPLEEKVKAHFEAKDIKLGMVMTPFRIAVVGTTNGPGMFEIAELIGKNEVIKRIENAIRKITISQELP